MILETFMPLSSLLRKFYGVSVKSVKHVCGESENCSTLPDNVTWFTNVSLLYSATAFLLSIERIVT